MQAAVLRDFGQLTLESVPVPEPGPGEVLVRVRACGLCGTDLKIVSGGFRGTWPPALPFIIGHEWSGEVAAGGPDTERSGLIPQTLSSIALRKASTSLRGTKRTPSSMGSKP